MGRFALFVNFLPVGLDQSGSLSDCFFAQDTARTTRRIRLGRIFATEPEKAVKRSRRARTNPV
jgi:hypothetical protein